MPWRPACACSAISERAAPAANPSSAEVQPMTSRIMLFCRPCVGADPARRAGHRRRIAGAKRRVRGAAALLRHARHGVLLGPRHRDVPARQRPGAVGISLCPATAPFSGCERFSLRRPGATRCPHPHALRDLANRDPLRFPPHAGLNFRPRPHSRRSATVSMRWLAPFLRIRLARWRVGTMFSRRLVRLMRFHRLSAVAIASSSGISA